MIRTPRALILAAALGLTGCSAQSFFGEQNPPELYVLRPPAPEVNAPRAAWPLTVAEPEAPLGLNTAHIAIQRSPETLEYYADADWQDRAPALVQSALIEGFEKSGKIGAVARDSQGLKSDYLLQSELRRFEAVYVTAGGAPTIVVEIGLRLMRLSGRSIVASTVIEKRQIASANTIPAAVVAFDEATGAAVTDAVAWTLQAPKGK